MAATNVKEAIAEAHKLLSEKHWTTGEYARNHFGQIVSPVSADADSYCLLGAIKAVTEIDWDTRPSNEAYAKADKLSLDAYAYFADFLRKSGADGTATSLPHEWNDAEGRSKNEVLAMLDAAAREAPEVYDHTKMSW